MIKRISILLLCLSCVAQAENLNKYYRLLAARSTGPELWTPADAQFVGVWYDGSDQTTMFADTNATTSVTNLGAVARWNDKSGNERWAWQTNTALMPQYQQDVFNGNSVLSFTTDRMVSESFTLAQPHYVFVVEQRATNANAVTIDSYETAISAFYSFSAGYRVNAGTAYNPSVAVVTNLAMHYIQFHGTNSAYALNGATPAIGNAGANSKIGLSIGNYYGKPNAVANEPLRGSMCQIVIITNSITADTRQRLEGWAAHKYGLTADLPEGHPYKTSAPTK